MLQAGFMLPAMMIEANVGADADTSGSEIKD
jgi:hypothetical protein